MFGLSLTFGWLICILYLVLIVVCYFSKPDFPDSAYQCGSIRSQSNHECYFHPALKDGGYKLNPTYEIMRDQFRDRATALKAQIRTYTVPVANDSDEGELTTDIAILPGVGSGKGTVLIHISGTHGPEGYCGSAIQSAYMDELDTESYDPTTLAKPTRVFVHALNPYGFKYSRRMNENNVDLNRNFLTEEEFESVKQRDANFAGYVDMDHLLNPPAEPTNIYGINYLYRLFTSAIAVLTHGTSAIKRAMVSGTYHKPTGLYYGGNDLQPSARNLLSFLDEHFSNFTDYHISDAEAEHDGNKFHARKVLVIDVHSGLGFSGYDTLAVDGGSVELAHSIFTPDYDDFSGHGLAGKIEDPSGATCIRHAYNDLEDDEQQECAPNEALSGYEHVVGGVTKYICEKFGGFANIPSRFENISSLLPEISDSGQYSNDPDSVPTKLPNAKICLTQEFGTVAPFEVASALIDENFVEFNYNKQDRARR